MTPRRRCGSATSTRQAQCLCAILGKPCRVAPEPAALALAAPGSCRRGLVHCLRTQRATHGGNLSPQSLKTGSCQVKGPCRMRRWGVLPEAELRKSPREQSAKGAALPGPGSCSWGPCRAVSQESKTPTATETVATSTRLGGYRTIPRQHPSNENPPPPAPTPPAPPCPILDLGRIRNRLREWGVGQKRAAHLPLL